MAEELDVLLDKVADASLRAQLRSEIDKVRAKRTFGLVFESHLPERVRLPEHPVRRGTKVVRRAAKNGDTMRVTSVRRTQATVALPDGGTDTIPLDDLVVVAEFGEPVYPASPAWAASTAAATNPPTWWSTPRTTMRSRCHLYADSVGQFPAELNTWETTVLATELARPTFVAWYRKPSRPTPASLRIAYQTTTTNGPHCRSTSSSCPVATTAPSAFRSSTPTAATSPTPAPNCKPSPAAPNSTATTTFASNPSSKSATRYESSTSTTPEYAQPSRSSTAPKSPRSTKATSPATITEARPAWLSCLTPRSRIVVCRYSTFEPTNAPNEPSRN